MTTTNPKQPPKKRQLTYLDYEVYGRWISVILLIAAVWLIGACISATSGMTVQCDAQNVPTEGCANP